jgi:hypothetical protein
VTQLEYAPADGFVDELFEHDVSVRMTRLD